MTAMNNNHTWLLPALKEAIRDGDLTQARALADLGDTDRISNIPLLEAIRRGEQRLEILQVIVDAPTSYATFDAYAAAIPAGEEYRNWLGNKPGLRLIAGTGPHSGLPGGFLWAYVLSRADGWCVLVGDCDDGMIVKYCVDMDKSQRALDDLITLAPFAMHELDTFGYHWD
jgi:hypothetical protein